jgi:hypothetical protein
MSFVVQLQNKTCLYTARGYLEILSCWCYIEACYPSSVLRVIIIIIIIINHIYAGYLQLYAGHAAGDAVGWGTELQAGRSRVRFPMVSPEFFLTYSFRPHYSPGVDSACNRNEHQEYFPGDKGSRCIGLTTLPTSCVNCFEVLDSQPPGTVRACPSL